MRYFCSNFRSAVCHLRSGEIRTQSGLAVTPSAMLEMAEAGVPISSVNAESMYDDGQRSLPIEPPLERRRGIDIGDLWEANMEVRKKVKALYKMKGEQNGTSGTES